MTDLVQGYGDLRRATGAPTGRHAFDEDAALTPIFHALSRGGTRREAPRRSEAVDDFRRDPLTAPIPVQAFAAAAAPSPRLAAAGGTRSGRRRARHEHPDGGRHTPLAG